MESRSNAGSALVKISLPTVLSGDDITLSFRASVRLAQAKMGDAETSALYLHHLDTHTYSCVGERINTPKKAQDLQVRVIIALHCRRPATEASLSLRAISSPNLLGTDCTTTFKLFAMRSSNVILIREVCVLRDHTHTPSVLPTPMISCTETCCTRAKENRARISSLSKTISVTRSVSALLANGLRNGSQSSTG